MTLRGVLSALGRRWYFVLVGLLITAGGAWAALSITPPQYAARGLILLLFFASPMGMMVSLSFQVKGAEGASLTNYQRFFTDAEEDVSLIIGDASWEVIIPDEDSEPTPKEDGYAD